MQKNLQNIMEYQCMSETVLDRIQYIQYNPWLFDDTLSPEEQMAWKLKGECHICGIDPRHHRDDCMFSAVQQMFASIASGGFSYADFYYSLKPKPTS